ncbi:MAG: 4-(cytidine 5'-diphospho)-2-C-methyl-D-erythritol kinase [Cereibacter sphaeroides]|uniref:4-diphosphocytidyl-2-C-methyl-D-erythritol kinase n=1 Tax=Cereibacter sphaeroides TaxID=1063 RepID=A0A2W5SDR3_CERSP|nr:MAG: 4-(cytidine 5'-diphospho)-2-C-methyl-D-erythritol kinase [Cereibacter sphaeroides]
MAISAFAPAKINLCLHVTGRRPDGYHLLDSLVAFADVGDRIEVTEASDLTLQITGPQADGLSAGNDNLVLRAARLLGAGRGAAIRLDKVLPVASGIGGGSADAAAALRALSALWDVPLLGREAVLRLGADVPVCLDAQPMRMSGVGEVLEPLGALPQAGIVLVNPRQGLSTPAVFGHLESRDNPPLPHPLPDFATLDDLIGFLQQTRNDLEAPAIRLLPVIAAINTAITAQPGCRFARMSGSGATCFGLFQDLRQAKLAAEAIRAAEPGWWVEAAGLQPSS